MKLVVILFSLVVGLAVQAKNDVQKRTVAQEAVTCASGGIDEIVKQVKAAGSCFDAGKIAENCAMGSSADTQIAGSATAKCEADMGKLTTSDSKLYKTLTARCAKVCNPRNDGTLCLSNISFCNLGAAKFMYLVVSSNAPN